MTPEEEQRAYQRLGTPDPQCLRCGERHPAALTGGDGDILCYQCGAVERGRSAFELHHPAGRHNSVDTVAIPANDHRVLSSWQARWPQDVLTNPQNSPLRSMAAAIQGWLDILRLIIERTIGWIPNALVRIDDALVADRGAQWWLTLGLAPQ